MTLCLAWVVPDEDQVSDPKTLWFSDCLDQTSGFGTKGLAGAAGAPESERMYKHILSDTRGKHAVLFGERC